MTWLFKTVSGMKFVDDGVGIIVQGNKGVFQHIFECTIKGSKIKVPTFCTYLFNGQKCKIHRTIKTADFLLSANSQKDFLATKLFFYVKLLQYYYYVATKYATKF